MDSEAPTSIINNDELLHDSFSEDCNWSNVTMVNKALEGTMLVESGSDTDTKTIER